MTIALANLLGFLTGIALFATLLRMALPPVTGWRGVTQCFRRDPLPFLAGGFGLAWNAGALCVYGLRDLGSRPALPVLEAVAYSALGFLPAAVVHAARRDEGGTGRPPWETVAAYLLSAVAAGGHVGAAVLGMRTPAPAALWLLTAGYVGLTLALIPRMRDRRRSRRTLGIVTLSVFVVSVLHLGFHGGHDSLLVEVVGHHASILLAVTILYQDYRFALADMFLKQALSLVALVSVVFGLHVTVGAKLLAVRDATGQIDPRAVGGLLGLWVFTALVFPGIWKAVATFVDRVVLRHADYGELRAEIARAVAARETPEDILDEVCRRLGPALTASDVRWVRTACVADDKCRSEAIDFSFAPRFAPVASGPVAGSIGELGTHPSRVLPGETGDSRRAAATVEVVTAEAPHYLFVIGELAGGRRLFSADTELLEAVALLVARRIDAVRVTHERCERNLREQEIGKLATEAELRALRAQVNPHFLFNALTTIGYLIQTSPDRALETLMRLTSLLRAVLRKSEGDFTALGEEMDLIEAYLAIERERFEERLTVIIDIPPDLRHLRIPPLIVQPLVENAIKHGIAPHKQGGRVTVAARLDAAFGPNDGPFLILTVSDTGPGTTPARIAEGAKAGVGISNTRRRLAGHFGEVGSLALESTLGVGTTATLRLPVKVRSEAAAVR